MRDALEISDPGSTNAFGSYALVILVALAFNDETHDRFVEILEKANWDIETILTDFIAGTALRLTRILAY